MAMAITQILYLHRLLLHRSELVLRGTSSSSWYRNIPIIYLSFELSDEQKPLESHMLAGIILKNSLDANHQWVFVDPLVRVQIKEFLLRTLGSPVSEARHFSSQVIAKFASIEIPHREWPELVGRLLLHRTQQGVSSPQREAKLRTIGYLCEDGSAKDLEQDQVNADLNAVVQGMTQSDSSSEVRLVAVKALDNALGFA